MNMAINKVIYGGNALIDLTGDDVTAASLYEGVKAHDKSGAQITGTNPYNAANVDPAVTSALAALTEKGVDTTGAGLADIAGLVAAIESGGGSIVSGELIFAEDNTEDVEITHDLGAIPKAAAIFRVAIPNTLIDVAGTNDLVFSYAAVVDELSVQLTGKVYTSNSLSRLNMTVPGTGSDHSITAAGGSSSAFVSATETAIVIRRAKARLVAGLTYVYLIMA